jgi:hypothetical protein
MNAQEIVQTWRLGRAGCRPRRSPSSSQTECGPDWLEHAIRLV